MWTCPKYPGAQALGEHLHLGMPAGCRPQGQHVPKSAKSRAQCLSYRACSACHTAPRFRALPASAPGMFSCGQSAAWHPRSLPRRLHPTPEQGLGRTSYYCTGYCSVLQAGKRECKFVCDSSPPNPVDAIFISPSKFLSLSRLSSIYSPLHSLLHFTTYPFFQKVNISI